MSVKDAAFPSSATFDTLNQALSDSGERQDAIAKGNGIYAFTLTNTAGQQQTWYIDLKEKGQVFQGAAPKGRKADDSDFNSLITGQSNAQRLFLSGKLKIRGNMMKATKMEPILKKAQVKAKL